MVAGTRPPIFWKLGVGRSSAPPPDANGDRLMCIVPPSYIELATCRKPKGRKPFHLATFYPCAVRNTSWRCTLFEIVICFESASRLKPDKEFRTTMGKLEARYYKPSATD